MDPRTRGLFPALGLFIAFMLVLSVRAVVSRAGVYAYVNEQPIGKPMVDFEKEMILRGEGKVRPTPPQEVAARNAAVDLAIERCLAAAEARRRGLQASREMLASYRRQVMERIEALGPRDEVLAALRLSEHDLQTEVERDALKNLLMEQVDAEVPKMTEEELARFYDEHLQEFREDEAAYVLLMSARRPPDPAGASAARERLDRARQQVLDGADFRSVAATMPEGVAPRRGGDLGFVKPGYLPPVLEAAVASLPDGQISEVLETRDAFHVVQVLTRRRVGYTPYVEVRGGIRQRLHVMERYRRFGKLMNRLRASAHIVRYDESPSLRRR